tara:strand:+ start:2843 stop:3757 length:915 start_codon:yes stop_codon:yes gene_type:complete
MINLNETTTFNYIDLPILILSVSYLGFLFSSGYNFIKNYNKSKKKKEVIIIRGVPGSGKNLLIYDYEKYTDDNFLICSTDDYYKQDGTYNFYRKEVNKAERYCFQKFHDGLKFNIPKIYIENNNNKLWMYANYISLAYAYNYKVTIIEICCPDEEHLHYFNKRSIHNPPYSYSKNIYIDWDEDDNSIKLEPYLGNFKGPLPGDSLPAYPPITKKQLDNELDKYREQNLNEECIINSDDEDENDYSKNSELESYDIIDMIDKNDINEVNKRNIYINRSFNDNTISLTLGNKEQEYYLNEIINYTI